MCRDYATEAVQAFWVAGFSLASFLAVITLAAREQAGNYIL